MRGCLQVKSFFLSWLIPRKGALWSDSLDQSGILCSGNFVRIRGFLWNGDLWSGDFVRSWDLLWVKGLFWKPRLLWSRGFTPRGNLSRAFLFILLWSWWDGISVERWVP